MIKPSDTHNINARIPLDLYEAAARRAALEDRSLSNFVIHVLRIYLRQKGAIE